MALVVDTTIRYQSAPQGQNFTFSLSKPLNELTSADIMSVDAFAGFNSFAHNQLAEGNLGTGIPDNNPNHCWAWSNSDPFGSFPSSLDGTFWSYPANFATGVYMRNIFVYRPLNTGGGSSLTNTNDAVRLVLEVTPDSNTSIQKLEAVTGNNGPFIRVRYNNDQYAETRLTDYNYISPAVMLIVNDVLYLFVQRLGVAYQAYTCWNTMTAQGYNGGYQDFENSGTDHQLGLGWTRGLADTPILTDMIIDSQAPYTGTGHFSNVDFNGRTGQLNLSKGQSSGDIWHRSTLTLSLTDVDENKDITKMYLAFSGCRFKVDDTWYKPIVEGGIIVGYTDDMTVQSEWDTWTKATGHKVPSDGGGADDDEVRDPSHYGTYSGGAGAFARCWLCNSAALQSLWSWLGNAPDDPTLPGPPEGFNPINSFIGLSCFPVNIPHTGNKVSIVFWNAQSGEGEDRTVNTHVSNDVYLSSGATFEIDLGTVKVPRHYSRNGFADNDWAFIDYDTSIELYIPFCGVFNVDPQVVMGNTIQAKLIVDPIAGSCTCIATCNAVDIAMGSGQMSTQLPVSANQYSMVLASVNTTKNNIMASIAGSVTAAVGGAIVNGMKGMVTGRANAIKNMLNVAGGYDDLADIYGVGGASKIARQAAGKGFLTGVTSTGSGWVSNAVGSAVANTITGMRSNKMAQAANNTAVSGSFGGSQDSWKLPMQAYVRILRETVRVATNHFATHGRLHIQSGTLGNCKGMTVLVNPDLSGLTSVFTTNELADLYTTLCNGIYAGGGEEPEP